MLDRNRSRARAAIGLVAGLASLSAYFATPTSASTTTKIPVVAAENEYGNVASQIGGQYVTVESIESNPNTDPHTYEVNPGVARSVSVAQLVIQNGVGYDSFMKKVESASPNSKRRVITVQTLLGLPNSTPNPHLWYKPTTMPAVAKQIAADLSALQPAHAAYFRSNLTTFDNSLKPWLNAIASFKAKYANSPAATTEPVSDYLLEAMGVNNLTPFGMQADIMNGVDPSPQDITLQDSFFAKHKVKVFVYNQQVVDSLTTSFRTAAEKAGIPVVGVYETMPTPGYSYQSWMLAEVNAIKKAITQKVSTEKL